MKRISAAPEQNPEDKRDEVTTQDLKAAIGKKVEAYAFGVAYRGRLKKVDLRANTIRINDRRDYAVLEIERIESFKIL